MSIRINNKTIADKTPIDTNTTLGNSDSVVPSQNAVKTYVDTAISDNVPTKLSELEDDLGDSPVHTHEQYITSVPTKLSELEDDLGDSPTHTHQQYLTDVTFSSLSDISISNPSDGDAIVYDSQSGKWKNSKVSVSVSYDSNTGTLHIQ